MSRFDHIKMDEHSLTTRNALQRAFEDLEDQINVLLPVHCENKELAMRSLEVAAMFLGKATRDDQKRRAELRVEEDDGA